MFSLYFMEEVTSASIQNLPIVLDAEKLLAIRPLQAHSFRQTGIVRTMVQIMRVDAGSTGPLAGSKGNLDLGGMLITTAEQGGNLLRFVGIALFRPDGSLMF